MTKPGENETLIFSASAGTRSFDTLLHLLGVRATVAHKVTLSWCPAPASTCQEAQVCPETLSISILEDVRIEINARRFVVLSFCLKRCARRCRGCHEQNWPIGDPVKSDSRDRGELRIHSFDVSEKRYINRRVLPRKSAAFLFSPTHPADSKHKNVSCSSLSLAFFV
jgi:hypothetical protein